MREAPSEGCFSDNPRLRTNARHVLLFASIGNALELYDFTLYGLMLPFFASQFFPVESPAWSLMIGYFTFALTFFVAPVGSIFWGWYAEKFGSACMLRKSMIFMAIPSTAIALLPTYEHIGALAPIILVLLRIMQGLSASGEVIGSKIFAMEALGPKHYGLCSGFISAAGALGILLGMAMVYLTSSMPSYPSFWRLAFLLSTLLFIVARYIRTQTALSYASFGKQSPKQSSAILPKLLHILKAQPKASLSVFLLGAYLGIASYSMHAFMSHYLVSHDVGEQAVYRYSILGMCSTMVGALLAGFYVDKFTSLKALVHWLLAGHALAYIPLFYCLLLGNAYTGIGYICLGAMLGAYAAACAVMMYQAFTPQYRCRGLLFCYALGCSILGGITPVLMHGLSQINWLAPAFFPAATACLSSLILIKLNKNDTLL